MIDENLLPVERREEREFLYAVSYQPVRRLNECILRGIYGLLY